MKLRSLRIHGFKSFADRTEIEFREGVTAIVGSNGCGKSNVADAIRWVLGEQRASAVRGSKMEEVIFQGTTKRRPLNFAEVSLLFSNEHGRVPVPQAEIEVARKTFREGGSEYALNRTACRLRDIHNLLRDTGLGANAYSVIEAGMIETLLSDRAEERRMLFEEAAGVGRYKDSRHSASRRLDAAEGDLARLDDLISEVESKVRSLARQRRKAHRHAELQARRLDLEVAIARNELQTLHSALATGERRQAELDAEEISVRAERSTAETLLEELRADVTALGQRRIALAAQLDELRQRLDAREREVLLADERRSHAEMRIGQLVRERSDLERRLAALAGDADRLTWEGDRARTALEALRERHRARSAENDNRKSGLAAQRQAAEVQAGRWRSLARDIAAAEGERNAAERRHREAEERLGRLHQQDLHLTAELGRLTEQTEQWSIRAEELRGRVAVATELADDAREQILVLRVRGRAAREAFGAAEDHLSRLTAQVAAREALERGYEGFSPAVAAVMATHNRFPGVHGPLADFIAASADDAAGTQAAEVFLGPLLQALVVEDLATARELRRWFRDEWKGGGSLLLLPCDAPGLSSQPAGGFRRSLPVRGHGHGGAWAEQLLADLVVVTEGDSLDAYVPDAGRITPGGDLLDARGVVRLLERSPGEGILARRELLARMRAERENAERSRDLHLGDRQALAAGLAAAEEREREAEEVRRVAQARLQHLEAEAAADAYRRTRLQQERDELHESVARLRQSAADAAARVRALDAQLADSAQAVEIAGAEAEEARRQLATLEAGWEEARDEEAELRVSLARAEAELRETERRATAAAQGSNSARSRIAAVDREAAELRASLEALSGVRERAGDEIDALFRGREHHAAELRNLDARLTDIEADITREAECARRARRKETECSEERHRLELQNAELRSRIERVRERLEAEWGRPWDTLIAAANAVDSGDVSGWNAELREAALQLEALGPVNMLAVEEHEEEERRLSFLQAQRADLVKARDDLAAAIRQINRTAREMFMTTFATIRENFHRTFGSLFQGGECDIWLADPDDPLESPVEIQASPKGKRTQRIHLLSGGERTLTALALLFALYLVKPSPFCVLDEIDAPLDESNVGRFIQLLHDFKAETQFIVITHNTRTMEAADWIYGVTMEEPGISSIVGVELQGAWAVEDRVA
jgi:chromosome segregation protein